MTREEQLQTPRSRREWPVLIVGGGINDAGVLRDLALHGAALEKMASDALASGSPANNPVVPTASEIVQLYRQAW